MIFEDDILQYLQEGGNLEDYLNAVTQAANTAQKKFQEEKNQARKAYDADTIAASINQFVKTYYPSEKWGKPLTGEDVLSVFDIMAPLARSVANTMTDAGDPIQDFLNTFVRIR